MRSAADAAPSFVYLPDLASRAGEFTLAGEEARYLAKVVRARDGERTTASDGAGRLATLRVVSSRPDLVLSVESRWEVPAPPEARVLCGAPEGERGDWLVEKLGELGATDWVPVHTQRARWSASLRLERWERLAVAALRQSRSAWRMRVAEPVPLEAALSGLGPGQRWLADAAGVKAAALELPPAGGVTGAVGPSSGFSDDERKLLVSHGFVCVCLAIQRLRAETAALAMAAHWAARRDPVAEPRTAREP